MHRQNEHHRVDAHVLGDLRHHFDQRVKGRAVRPRNDGDERRDHYEKDGHADRTGTD